jgi:hypothetical protein
MGSVQHEDLDCVLHNITEVTCQQPLDSVVLGKCTSTYGGARIPYREKESVSAGLGRREGVCRRTRKVGGGIFSIVDPLPVTDCWASGRIALYLATVCSLLFETVFVPGRISPGFDDLQEDLRHLKRGASLCGA